VQLLKNGLESPQQLASRANDLPSRAITGIIKHRRDYPYLASKSFCFQWFVGEPGGTNENDSDVCSEQPAVGWQLFLAIWQASVSSTS
jgi:hypothetical protein